MSLKIMYFLDDGQGFGGAANTLLQQAVLMKRAGHKVWLCISNERTEEIVEEYFHICEKSGIEMIRLPFQISSHPEDIDVISIISNYPVVRDAVREYAPDLLHSIQINPVVELAGRELLIPHIMNIYQIQEQFFSVSYTDLFARYHICDSWYYADIWKRMIHTDSVCIRTAAGRSSNRRRRDRDHEQVRYCCVGGMFTRKNQLEVMKAFEMAVREGVKGELHFYGYDRGSYADSCKQYVKEKNLEEFIKIRGFCSRMEEEYEKADVLLCGSTCESYPNVISEALAHGLVVISTPVAGVPEVIRDGYNGYLCEGYSGINIYGKIMEFDRERKNGKVDEILRNAENTYQTVHSPENVSCELMKYYGHVLEENRETSFVTAEEIREKFFELVNQYVENKDSFAHPDVVRLKLWYIYHIKEIVERQTAKSGKKVYIWGAGRLAGTMIAVMKSFFPLLRVQGFLDRDKQGGRLFELPVFAPEEIVGKKDNLILVGITNGQEEVLETLQRHSKVYNQDYFVLTPRIW